MAVWSRNFIVDMQAFRSHAKRCCWPCTECFSCILTWFLCACGEGVFLKLVCMLAVLSHLFIHKCVCIELCTMLMIEVLLAFSILENIRVILWFFKTSTVILMNTLVPKNVPPFYFSSNSVKNWTILMLFGVLNPQQLVRLPTWPVYCSHFTLGNPKKLFFNSIIHTYFRLFTSSHKKTNPLTHHTCKTLLHYLVKCTTFSSVWRYVAFFQTLVALKRAGYVLALVALETTGCDVWQMECQASNVTAMELL